jgi:hypothetical protein
MTATQAPEWIDAKEAKRLFSLGKTTLYALASEGKIRTSSLRERGKQRGKRLFSYDSIKAHIEARATGGESAQ